MANQEHLDKLKEGVEAWNQWREENPDTQPDLIQANLSGANLNRALLHEANLYNTSCGYTLFTNTDLQTVKGLETIDHRAPSTIGIDTVNLDNKLLIFW